MNAIEMLHTPCFVIDEQELQQNIENFKRALDRFFYKNILAYSVKTNSLPYILGVANTKGCFAEVVSYDEYTLAKKMGFSSQNIIYNGPMKDKETFYDALANGAIINVETWRELQWLKEYDGQMCGKIGIRVNINLSEIAPDEKTEEQGVSRFGFSYENGQLEEAIAFVQELGYQIEGLHMHRTSLTRSLYVYQKVCEYVNQIIETLKLDIHYIDIGGGFYGNYPGKPDYNDYVKVIRDTLCMDDTITLIVEPGNGLIASPLRYVISIIDKKKNRDHIILTTDGSRIDIDPMFHKESYNVGILTEQEQICDKKQLITGCTCLERDIITILSEEKELEVGDRLVFACQGAYTLTLTPNFIRLLPKVYVYDGHQYRMVREQTSVEEWTASSVGAKLPDAFGILFSNAGRRTALINDFKKSLGISAKIIATDNWSVAPALFAADQYYLVPKITEKNYINYLLELCKKENVKAITTCIDPEIELLAQNREIFLENGILPLCPDEKTAELCFDKYKMFLYLQECEIPTILTYASLDDFRKGYEKGDIDFPVFVKPRTGSGSIGIAKIQDFAQLVEKLSDTSQDYIIQEFMDCEDCDADVYIDTVSHQVVAAFLKKKIETRVGGASKTISFKDRNLFVFIEQIAECFRFCGPVDMDFFIRDGKYYLSEINPRFGGAYLHAYSTGVDFPKLIYNNIIGIKNKPQIGEYKENSIMLMYDDVIMTEMDELKGDYHD